MSVLDQFRTAEEQVAKRLRELKPLVAEYHELEHVAWRLGLNVSDDAPGPGTRPPTSTKPARRRRRAARRATRSAAPKRDGSANSGTTKASVAATQERPARSPQGAAGKSRAGSSRTSRRQQDVSRKTAKAVGYGRSQPGYFGRVALGREALARLDSRPQTAPLGNGTRFRHVFMHRTTPRGKRGSSARETSARADDPAPARRPRSTR